MTAIAPPLNALSMPEIAGASATTASRAPGDTPFSGLLSQALDRMGQLEQDASAKADGLLRGDGVDVHAAMISTERADLAFELALAVRNKAIAAYQQLNSMQF